MFDHNNQSTQVSIIRSKTNWFFFIIIFLIGYIFADALHRALNKLEENTTCHENLKASWNPNVYNIFRIKKYLQHPDFTPVVIIGGGCAGATSAIYLGLAGYNPLILIGKALGGTITNSSDVKNWPGEISIDGKTLANKLFEQAKANGAVFAEEHVVDIDLSRWPFHIKTKNVITESSKNYICPVCIIASGVTPKHLNIKGETEYWGKGVTNCAICDIHLAKNNSVVVVGGGDSALTEAITLSAVAKQVIILVRSKKLRAKEFLKTTVSQTSNIKIMFESELLTIHGDKNNVTGVTIKNRNTESKLPVTGVFLAIGSTPNTSLYKDQLTLDSLGCIKVDGHTHQTSIPGIFAAGDIVNTCNRQAIIAAGQGCIAALNSIAFLQFIGLSPVNTTTPKNTTLQEVEKKNIHKPNNVYNTTVIDVQSEKQLETLIDSISKTNKILLIDFYATWCIPCKNMSKILDKVVEQFEKQVVFCKVNIDNIPALASIYNIRGVPTILLIDSTGKELKKLVGEQEYQDLISEIKQLL